MHGAITQLTHWLISGHMRCYWSEPIAILALPVPIPPFRPIPARSGPRQYVNWLSEQSLHWCLVTKALRVIGIPLWVHCEDVEGNTATVPLPGKDELFGLRLNERCGTLAEALNMLSGSKRSLTRWCFAHHVQAPRGIALRCQNELPFFELRNYEVVRLSVCDDRFIGAEAEKDIGTADQDVPPAPLIVNEDYQ